jgi:hypothetical protein
MMNRRHQLLTIALLLCTAPTLWISIANSQTYTYTFYDNDEHLIASLDNGGLNLPLLPDQQFEFSNATGTTWTGMHLRLDGYGEFGAFTCEGFANYSGPGYHVMIDDDGDYYNRAETMYVYLCRILDGSDFACEVDILHLPPEGLVELDIYGDPVNLGRLLYIVAGNFPTLISRFGREAMVVAALPFELINDTETTWTEYQLTLIGFDEEREVFPFVRFVDTDEDQDIYEGPGAADFMDLDGIGGNEVMRVRDLDIPPGDSLVFYVDFRGFPPPGMMELEIIGQSFADLTAAPNDPRNVRGALDVVCTPNPFNPQTTIEFELVGDQPVAVAVYDLLGRVVRIVAEGQRSGGRNQVIWDGRNSEGRAMPSGTYVIRLETEFGVEARKVMLVR